jgi:hypothetical protein
VKDGDLSGNTEDYEGTYQKFTDRTGAKTIMTSPSFDAYLKPIQKNLQKGSERSHFLNHTSELTAISSWVNHSIEWGDGEMGRWGVAY